MASEWRMASKALRPLPVLHKDLSEESRVRQRYADLIVRQEARDMVRLRAAVLRSVRATLDGFDFVEVETPMLQLVHGGAAARPFTTHLNAFDQDMTLRIALELYLKRAVVGGVDRVYEIGRIFRNEGVDSTHSPEFTMLEYYEAYGDQFTAADRMRDIIVNAAEASGAGLQLVDYRGQEIDLSGEWRWLPIADAVAEAVGEDVSIDETPENAARLRAIAEAREVNVKPTWGAGEIILELFEQLVEETLVQPTFVCDYPESLRPAGPPAPVEARHRRGLGPDHRRRRARRLLLRADRPRRTARAADRAVTARRRRRPRGDAARRGLPPRARVRRPPDGRQRPRHRPPGDAAHRRRHPRDDPVPARAPARRGSARGAVTDRRTNFPGVVTAGKRTRRSVTAARRAAAGQALRESWTPSRRPNRARISAASRASWGWSSGPNRDLLMSYSAFSLATEAARREPQ